MLSYNTLGKGGAAPRCIPSAGGLSRPPCTPRRRAFLPLDPDHPCAGWNRASAMPCWTGNQGALPPDTPASGFRARHHEQGSSGPMHPGKALFALDPNQPRAGWICGNGVARCIASQGHFAPRHRRAAGGPLHRAP